MSLFKPGSEPFNDAIVGGNLTNPGSYVFDFRDTADQMVETAVSQRWMDSAAIPICFLYRQALELALKQAILDVETLIGLKIRLGELPERASDSKVLDFVNDTHKLDKLLIRLEERLTAAMEEPVDKAVSDAIQLVQEADPTGQRFRYPSVKQNRREAPQPSFPAQIRIDLPHVKVTMGSAIFWLYDCLGSYIENKCDIARDVISDLESNY